MPDATPTSAPAASTTPAPAAPVPAAPVPAAPSAAPAAPLAALATPDCNCGPLVPREDDLSVTGMSPETVHSTIQMNCKRGPGVLFFRFQGQLYLRVLKDA